MYAVYEEKGHQHWRTEIADSRGNTKKLWHTMHGILGEKQSGRRDDSYCSAEDFAKFFAKLTSSAHQPPSHHHKISPIQRATSSTSGSLWCQSMLKSWSVPHRARPANFFCTYLAGEGVSYSAFTFHLSTVGGYRLLPMQLWTRHRPSTT